MANDRLRDALMAARITHEDLAAELGVNAKTVERWITQARTPYPQFRHRISVLVQKDEGWLWPDGYSRKRRGEISRVRDRAHLPLPGRRARTSCGPGCSRTPSTTSASWSTPGSSSPSSTLARSSCSRRRPTTEHRSGSCSATRTARRSR